MKIILIRHTRPNVRRGICYGWSDIELHRDFNGEAGRLRGLVGDIGEGTRVYSSDLSRCTRLAEEIFEDFRVDDRLREMNFGEWELRPWDSIDKTVLHPWLENFVEEPAPGGESFAGFHRRVMDFFREQKEDNPDQLVLVTHSGVIRCFLCEVLSMPLENAFKLPVLYGSVHRFDWDEHKGFGKIEEFNRV